MARGRSSGLDGFVVVDKPAGMTSHDVVGRLRRQLHERRIGHAGTLDPDATGVLVVAVGRSTRLLRYVSGVDKSYEGTLLLGASTSTLDASGEVTGHYEMGGVTEEMVRAAAAKLTGEIDQVPPMVSAVKVDGRRLHELARAGEEVDRAPRRVLVSRFALGATDEPLLFSFEVDCGSGTFVRSLVDDLGRLLGGGAHLRTLRRTRVGSFSLAEAVPLAEVDAASLGPPVGLLGALARLEADEEAIRRITNGQTLDAAALGARGEGPFALLGPNGALLAVYERAADPGVLRADLVHMVVGGTALADG